MKNWMNSKIIIYNNSSGGFPARKNLSFVGRRKNCPRVSNIRYPSFLANKKTHYLDAY